MKKHMPWIISLLACIMALGTYLWGFNLQMDINSLNSTLNNRIGEIRTQMNDFRYEAKQYIKTEASFLSTVEWEYEKTDFADKSVTVIFKMIPKEYTEGKTRASIITKGNEYPLSYKDGYFSITKSIPIFSSVDIERVIIRDEDRVRTEELDLFICPRYDYLPTIYVNYMGDINTENLKDSVKAQFEGSVDVEINSDQSSQRIEDDIESILLHTYIDGVKTETKEIKYTEATEDFLQFDLNKAFTIPYKSRFVLYADIEDSLGLHYIAKISEADFDETGTIIFKSGLNNSAGVYDKEGTLLFDSADIIK